LCLIFFFLEVKIITGVKEERSWWLGGLALSKARTIGMQRHTGCNKLARDAGDE
jgi:hypothetical protein